MEENKTTQVSLTTVFLILAVVIIVVMGIFMYKFYSEKIEANEETSKLQSQVNSLNGAVSDLQGRIDSISEAINSTNSSNKDDMTYTISIRDEIYATIEATKDGKTISKELKMESMIHKFGTIDIPNIGKVALISESGGEACIVHIYQLINNEIKLLGDIDCGMDMVKEATYTFDIKNEDTVVINAKRDEETITDKFEMSAAIANTSVIDILNYGKVVLVAESGGEYYGIQVYRLSQDYITGKTKEIIKVGFIQHSM